MALRVVLAEDDDLLRGELAALLRSHGHEVLEVPDGGRLLVLLARWIRGAGGPLPSVLVTDVHMPVASGTSLAVALHDARIHLPVVVITGDPASCTRELRLLPRAQLLRKPFHADDLLRAIDESVSLTPA